MKLREYQIQAANTVEAQYSEGILTQLVELPTGTGKTVVMGEIARRRMDLGRILFVVHRQEINQQALNTFERATGRYVGMVMADMDEYAEKIICASIQTLAVNGRMGRVLNAGPIATVFIDECHHFTPNSTYARLVNEIRAMYPDALILGVSATPFRMDKEDITETFTPVFSRSITRMQDEEWLANTEWVPVYIPDMELAELRTRSKDGERDFSQEELADAMLPHAEEMAEKSVDLIGQRSTLIFAVSIPHMWALVKAYRIRGLNIRPIYGDMPKNQRREFLSDWKEGKIQAVVNVGVLTEGFDNPKIACLVMARPTQSPGLYTQMLGRGLRLESGKDDCLVIDFSGRPDINDDIIHVTLPDIMGLSEDKKEGTKEVPAYKLRLFRNWSPVALTMIPGTDTFLTSAQNSAFGIALDRSNGLWNVIQVVGDNVIVLSKRGSSMRKATETLTVALERAGVAKTLWRKNSPWHNTKPSEAQSRYLSRMSPSMSREAFEDGWNKAQYANAITFMLYGSVIRRWRKREARGN